MDADDALAALRYADLRELASYPGGTAGSIVTSDYATLTPDIRAPQAIETLRKQAIDAETVYQSYIVD